MRQVGEIAPGGRFSGFLGLKLERKRHCTVWFNVLELAEVSLTVSSHFAIVLQALLCAIMADIPEDGGIDISQTPLYAQNAIMAVCRSCRGLPHLKWPRFEKIPAPEFLFNSFVLLI